jgi:hypothetical protein
MQAGTQFVRHKNLAFENYGIKPKRLAGFSRKKPEVDGFKFICIDLGGLELGWIYLASLARSWVFVPGVAENFLPRVRYFDWLCLPGSTSISPVQIGDPVKIAVQMPGHFQLLFKLRTTFFDSTIPDSCPGRIRPWQDFGLRTQVDLCLGLQAERPPPSGQERRKLNKKNPSRQR